uniref:Uncharacterized protein n=1 Tax=Magnetospirillum gryphiswaldense TaxID=55518 RepID=A4U5I7_9PROT|nr:hypothetical protein MGR_4212 [Magnetospirillum gryphiswaldense MSR-1]
MEAISVRNIQIDFKVMDAAKAFTRPLGSYWRWIGRNPV